jgi:hypothetical protein
MASGRIIGQRAMVAIESHWMPEQRVSVMDGRRFAGSIPHRIQHP